MSKAQQVDERKREGTVSDEMETGKKRVLHTQHQITARRRGCWALLTNLFFLVSPRKTRGLRTDERTHKQEKRRHTHTQPSPSGEGLNVFPINGEELITARLCCWTGLWTKTIPMSFSSFDYQLSASGLGPSTSSYFSSSFPNQCLAHTRHWWSNRHLALGKSNSFKLPNVFKVPYDVIFF